MQLGFFARGLRSVIRTTGGVFVPWVAIGLLACQSDPSGLGPVKPTKEVNVEPAEDGVAPDPMPPDSGSKTDGDSAPPSDASPPVDAPRAVGNCNFGHFPAHKITPEVLLVFDRSSSMRKPVAGSANTRWAEWTDGAATVIQNRQTAVSWGLKFFPTASGCIVDDGVDVTVGAAQFSQVVAKIRGSQPDTGAEGSPLFQAVATALQGFPRADNPRFMVLTTDGQASCPAVPANAAAEAKASETVRNAAAAQVWSFVIGNAVPGTPQHNLLNDLATAGREAASGTSRYLPAQTKADMMGALDSIVARLSACLFSVNAPPLQNSVAMDIDGVGRVPRDSNHLEGWDYGPDTAKFDIKTLQVFGKACDQLRAAPTAKVNMTFGCLNVPPP